MAGRQGAAQGRTLLPDLAAGTCALMRNASPALALRTHMQHPAPFPGDPGYEMIRDEFERKEPQGPLRCR